MGLDEAKTFQNKLKRINIELILNHNDQNCTRGCSVTVELLAKESDIPKIQSVYADEYQKMLQGHDVNYEQMNAVFDPQAEQVVCPACGFKFSPTKNQCPDCGLEF